MIRAIGEAKPYDQGNAPAPRVGIVEDIESSYAASGIEFVRDGKIHRQRLDLSPEIVSSLRRFVARRVHNPDDAADIVQQTALLACEQRGTRHIDNFARWLLTVAHHLIVDHYRSGSRFTFTAARSALVDAEPVLQTRADLPLVLVECHEELGRFLRRIVRLSWLEHQVAVLMSDVYGYGDKHSAAELHMSVPCFKLMLHGARACLSRVSDALDCPKCAVTPVQCLRRLGVSCGLPEPQLFAVRGMLLEGLKR
jgi:DNA-directed RNA polymerase specialized sigma24 family protein